VERLLPLRQLRFTGQVITNWPGLSDGGLEFDDDLPCFETSAADADDNRSRRWTHGNINKQNSLHISPIFVARASRIRRGALRGPEGGVGRSSHYVEPPAGSTARHSALIEARSRKSVRYAG